MLDLELKVLSGISEGDILRFLLDQGQSLHLGRSPANDVVVYDPKAEKFQASIELREDGLFLVDHGSTHGTYLMGFEVEPGSKGVRVKSNQEFKIGDTLISVCFEEKNGQASKKPAIVELGAALAKKNSTDAAKTWGKKTKYALLLLLATLLLFAVFPSSPRRNPVARQSNSPLLLGATRVLGYYPKGSSPNLKDLNHPQYVRFPLPVSDQLIEFQYLSKSPLAVFVGQTPVVRLAPQEQSWERWAIIVRDAVSGDAPDLRFENLDNSGKSNHKQIWALWNARNTTLSEQPLTNAEHSSKAFEMGLYSAAEQATTLGGDPASLHALLRSLQRLLVLSLADMNQESVAFPVRLDAILPRAIEIRNKLLEIAERRKMLTYSAGELPQKVKSEHLGMLIDLAAAIDAEIWRLFHNRTQQAKLAAQAQNYAETLRNLTALKSLFTDKIDYRWREANAMLHNKKLVPSHVLKHASRYLNNHSR